jgi:hypothetical protein
MTRTQKSSLYGLFILEKKVEKIIKTKKGRV